MKRIPPGRQNLTVQLDRETVRRARILAAKRGISISRLVADTIERLVGMEDAYEAAMRAALVHLERGCHLGGKIRATREELHERRPVCRLERANQRPRRRRGAKARGRSPGQR